MKHRLPVKEVRAICHVALFTRRWPMPVNYLCESSYADGRIRSPCTCIMQIAVGSPGYVSLVVVDQGGDRPGVSRMSQYTEKRIGEVFGDV